MPNSNGTEIRTVEISLETLSALVTALAACRSAFPGGDFRPARERDAQRQAARALDLYWADVGAGDRPTAAP